MIEVKTKYGTILIPESETKKLFEFGSSRKVVTLIEGGR